MRTAAVLLIPFLLLVGIGLAVTVLLGVLVYRDAQRRGMEPLLWALVAVLVPSFVGLIIYLVVRRSYSAALCSQCGQPVREEFLACPHCGAALKLRCERCGCPVEADWKVCAQCGAPQPQGRESPTTARPAPAGDKGLWALLVCLLVLPVLVLVGILCLSAANYTAIGVPEAPPPAVEVVPTPPAAAGAILAE